MEDDYYKLLQGLTVADLRRVLSKYSIPLDTGNMKKNDLKRLYLEYDIPTLITKRQEEERARSTRPRKRTIEMVSIPTKKSPKKRKTTLEQTIHDSPTHEEEDVEMKP